MRAIVIHSAKDLRIDEMPEPAPGDGEVLVHMGSGGICGSDLHYFNDGGFGAIRLQEPMVLGHEVAGTIAETGPGVSGLSPGDRVAVNPSRPCGTCLYCREAKFNHCLDMRFYGSAMRMPHIQGAFREKLVADASQCARITSDVSMQEAAMAEPLSVTLHAVRQAGSLSGKRVLITGCGPIGALCVVASRLHGAGEITITDIVDAPLAYARAVGADRTINVATHADELAAFSADKGTFDVVFEASGNPHAIAAAMNVIRPGGTFVQIGVGGDASLPVNLIVALEIRMCGSFRFHEEFAFAAELISSRRVDLKPLISDVVPLSDALKAFEIANDRSRAMKVQVAFA
jgi:L-idonate 5-dehydrogenase